MTLQQARGYQKDANNGACHNVLASNEDNDGATGAQVNIHQPAAQVQVRQPSANVSVQQAQPQVTVNQGQPTIIVHQPAPTVTVNVPEPIITIRMPQPDVNVKQAKPQISVNQAQPQVSVVQPQDGDKANVITTGQNQQADVDVNQSNQAPKIQYTSDKAKVVIKQPHAQPTVNLVHAGDADDVADAGTNDAQSNQQTADAGQQASQGQPMNVSKILAMDLYNVNGNKLGDIEHVVTDVNGGNSVVIGHGGFLGMGEKQVSVPLNDIWMNNGRLVTRHVTDDQIKSMPEYDQGKQKDVDGNQSVSIGTSGT